MTLSCVRTETATLALVLLSCAVTATVEAQFPTTPPPPEPLRPLQLPPFEETTLANGLDVILVENHELPVVSIALTMPAGSSHEEAGKEGLADLTADLLVRGTTTRTAEQIAEAIEGVGASLNVGAGSDFFTVSTSVLKDHVPIAFDLIGDVLTHATFPADEVDLTRTRTLSALRAAEARPSFLASKFFAERLYGDHPYGRTATSATVSGITREDVVTFASSYLRPEGSLLVVAGDISMPEIRRLSHGIEEEWTGSPPPRPVLPTPTGRSSEILLVNRPGSAQSNILVGNLTMRPGDPDYYAAVVANHILGGGADARLFMILREEKGWTYGAYSSQTRPVDIGRFEGSAEVRTEVTDSALVELLHQLRRLRTEAVSAEELDGAKGFLLGSFPRQIETPQQIASQVRTVRLLQLDDDYLQTYRERLAAVSGDDIMRVTGRLIRPDSAVIVVVGDGPGVYDALASIAPVRIIDAEGNPLTPEALNPTPEAVVFDHSQIVERRDSFAILVQGNPFGAMTRSIASATVDGRDVLQFTSELSLGPMASQKSMLLVDRATLKPVKLDQTGQQQGQPLEVHIEYGTDGRVTGSASVPEPGGRREVAVDTVLGEYVIDDNMLQALAGALPLSDGNTFTVSAYDATQGSVSRISAKVTDAGVVTVPAGEFPAWKVALSGTEAPLEYWVSKASPRRLVKIALIGQPVSFELVAGGSE